MFGRGLAKTVLVVGGVGMVVGVALAHGPQDSETGLGLAVALLLLGLAIWNYRTWGLGKLIPIAVVAVPTLLLNLFDFADGEPVWSQGHSGDDLIGRWLTIASAVAMLVGVLWSLRPPPPPRASEPPP